MRTRTFTELISYSSFEERYEYLKLRGAVGVETFGFDRYMNQRFYTSSEWRHVRNFVIDRDRGMDLACEGYEIHERIIIHHMNPITVDDIKHGAEEILDPEFLITTTHLTHNAIHYGDAGLLRKPSVVRAPGDTDLWAPTRLI